MHRSNGEYAMSKHADCVDINGFYLHLKAMEAAFREQVVQLN